MRNYKYKKLYTADWYPFRWLLCSPLHIDYNPNLFYTSVPYQWKTLKLPKHENEGTLPRHHLQKADHKEELLFQLSKRRRRGVIIEGTRERRERSVTLT